MLDLATSIAATVVRGFAGRSVGPLGARPDKPLEVYEFEQCPFCRKVREGLSMLDLDARIFPCPRNGTRFRPEAVRRGGRSQFPYLIDPNTHKEMYESQDILRYLFDTYGTGRVPVALSLGPITQMSSGLASAWRVGHASGLIASRPPEKPLELWSFESSPYCRLARETLCALEIPYLLHNIAKGSPKRPAFRERTGKLQFPYLEDPNTGAAMFESNEIVRYLQDTYRQ